MAICINTQTNQSQLHGIKSQLSWLIINKAYYYCNFTHLNQQLETFDYYRSTAKIGAEH